MLERFMVRFAQWFASPKAVIQVFILTTLWSIFEFMFPHVDPNGFKFLYICTVWGVQTQNILAYASLISANQSNKTQELIMQLLQNNVHQMEAQKDMLQAIAEVLDKLHALEQKDAEAIDDIVEELKGE